MRQLEFLKLNSGHQIPQFGLGTWQSKPGDLASIIENAIEIGYRHFDCARIYGNEAEIGTALSRCLSQGKITRDSLFITSKVWSTYHSYKRALECIDMSIRDLQVQYLDMCLIHWPMGYFEGIDSFPVKPDGTPHYSDVDFLETWKAMEDAVYAGKVKSIGLSNFNQSQVERVMQNCRIQPSNVQIEVHPYFTQESYVDWLKSKNIVITAYSPFGNPGSEFRSVEDPMVMNDPLFEKLAAKYSKSSGQIILRWHIQRGVVVIPKSSQRKHLEDNAQIWDFTLSSDDMKCITNLNRNYRSCPLSRDDNHPDYPFK